LYERRVWDWVSVRGKFFSRRQRPDRSGDPSSLLFNGQRGFSPRDKAVETWSWTLTSN
jgi:hypothetical protein